MHIENFCIACHEGIYNYYPATAEAGAAPPPDLGAPAACCYIYRSQNGHFLHINKVPFLPMQHPEIPYMDRSHAVGHDAANGMTKFELVRDL